jgi:hypothetical protein
MPVTALDVLVGVRFAASFDKRGYIRTRPSKIKHCRRVMSDIVAAHGNEPPIGNVVTLSATSRRLQAQRRALQQVVALHCRACNCFREGDCRGVIPPDLPSRPHS